MDIPLRRTTVSTVGLPEGLGQAVDVGIVAVTFVREGFHGAVLEIVGAKAKKQLPSGGVADPAGQPEPASSLKMSEQVLEAESKATSAHQDDAEAAWKPILQELKNEIEQAFFIIVAARDSS